MAEAYITYDTNMIQKGHVVFASFTPQKFNGTAYVIDIIIYREKQKENVW